MYTISGKTAQGILEHASVVYEDGEVAEAVLRMIELLKSSACAKIEVVCGESTEVEEAWRQVTHVKFVE